MPTIAVVNTKGGVGKTVTAMLLAAQAASSGYASRVLDADPQGTATKWGYATADAGTPLPFEIQPANVGLIERTRSGDSWTFIDTPPGQSAAIKAAIDAADFVIIPTVPATADLWQTLPTADVVGDKPFGILITMARAGTTLLREFTETLTAGKLPWFTTTVPLRESIKDLVGKPLSADENYGPIFDELVSVTTLKEVA